MTIATTEDFFEAYAGSIDPAPESYDSLTEAFQGVMTGFYVELIDIDNGGRWQLSVSAHDATAWNIDDAHPRKLMRGESTTIYAFATLAEALQALATFQRVALS